MKTFILAGFMGLLFTSCVTYERCQSKFGQQEDTLLIPYEKLVPIKVTVPPDSTTISLMVDSLLSLKQGIVYTEQNDSSSIKIQYWIDKYRKLQIKAIKPPQEIHDTIPIRDTIRIKPDPILINRPSKWQVLWIKYCEYTGVILPLLILLVFWLRRK